MRSGWPRWRVRVCCAPRSSTGADAPASPGSAPAAKAGGHVQRRKNRLHKVLVDAGIRINVLVADIHGQSARAMVKALIEDSPCTRC